MRAVSTAAVHRGGGRVVALQRHLPTVRFEAYKQFIIKLQNASNSLQHNAKLTKNAQIIIEAFPKLLTPM